MPKRHKFPSKGVKAFRIPIYTGWVYMVSDPKVMAKINLALGLEHHTDVGGSARHVRDNNTGTSCFLIGVYDGKLSTFVHELAHITFMILEWVNVPVPDGKANEAYCYLYGAMFELSKSFYKGLK